MSKITNEGLTWSGTGCFIAVPILQQWASTVKLSYCSYRVNIIIHHNVRLYPVKVSSHTIIQTTAAKIADVTLTLSFITHLRLLAE